MGYSTHRIVKHVTDQEASFAVHEVHYNDAGRVWRISAEPKRATGRTVEEIRSMLNEMVLACDRPILDANMECDSPDADAV